MKKIYTLVGCILASGAIIAQVPAQFATYNFGNSGKHTPGAITTVPVRSELNQDRTTYFSEDFDGGFAGWANTVQAGTAPFKLTSTGHDNNTGNTFIIPTLATTTPTQWILLDSDADGTSYSAPEQATFNSPKIDLSAAAGDFVALQFDQFFAEWDINTYTNAGSEDHCYIAVSTDSATWTEVEINEGVGREARPNPEMVSWDITDFIAGSPSTVWFRFRWEGAWNYGWQFDNVGVVSINEKDITIMDTYRGYNSLHGLGYSMVPQAHATEFVIGAIIRNTGHVDQSNIAFDFEIKDPSNAVVASGTATSTITLTSGQQDTLLVGTGFTATDLGNYTVTWTATSTEGDDYLTDNEAVDAYYELTDYTYAVDYNEGSPVGITNWPLTTGVGTFGNLFDFATVDVVSAIQVKIANNAANVGELIFYRIYYNDGTDWLFLDESADDYTIKVSDLGQIITLPIPNGTDVDPNYLYLFMVGQYATPTAPIFERQGNIGWDYITGMTETDGYAAFFDRLAPIVRIRVNANEVGIEEGVIEEHFAVYPNPASESINVSLSLNQSENTVINVLDITGKVVKTMNLGNVDGTKNFTVSLDEMTSGIYFVELVNAEGVQVKKFVKK